MAGVISVRCRPLRIAAACLSRHYQFAADHTDLVYFSFYFVLSKCAYRPSGCVAEHDLNHSTTSVRQRSPRAVELALPSRGKVPRAQPTREYPRVPYAYK